MARGSQKFTSFFFFNSSFLRLLRTLCLRDMWRRWYSRAEVQYCAWQSPQAITLCTGLQRIKIPVKPVEEGRREKRDMFFLSYFAMIMTLSTWIMQCLQRPLFFPSFFFFIAQWFSCCYRSIMYCPPVHSIARTLQSQIFLALSNYFKGISVILATLWFEYWFNAGTVLSLLIVIILMCDSPPPFFSPLLHIDNDPVL